MKQNKALRKIVVVMGLISASSLIASKGFAQTASPSPIAGPESPPTDVYDQANYKPSEAACLQEASNRELSAHQESYTNTPCVNNADDEHTVALTSEKSKTFQCIYNPSNKKWLVYLASEWKTTYKWASTISERYGCLASAYIKSDYYATYGACYSEGFRMMTTWSSTVENVTGFNLTYSYPNGPLVMPKITTTLGTLNGSSTNMNCGMVFPVYNTWQKTNMPMIYAPTLTVPN